MRSLISHHPLVSFRLPIRFLLLAVIGLFASFAWIDDLQPHSASAADDTAAPVPFLYLPFNLPNGWRYPSSYFDHHFPNYRNKAKPAPGDEATCTQTKLRAGLGDDLAVAPTFEYNGWRKLDTKTA